MNPSHGKGRVLGPRRRILARSRTERFMMMNLACGHTKLVRCVPSDQYYMDRQKMAACPDCHREGAR